MNRAAKLVEWVPARVAGREAFRLMVVLAAPGCAWHAKSGGCANCAFPGSLGTGVPVSAAEYAAQLESALARVPADYRGPLQLDLFVSGSFFNADEVPVEAQEALLRRAGQVPGLAHVLVETRPEYVEAAALARARAALGEGPVLEVGIGLESADTVIREQRVNKGFTWEQFEGAARLLAEARVPLLAYVLLKPMDTGEAEAIEDAARSAERVFGLGAALGLQTRVAIEPCFVAPGTPLSRAFEEGRYEPPRLWSVLAVLARIAPLGPVKVGLSDEGLNPARAPRNCEGCSGRVREALAGFNATQRLEELAGLDCECRRGWREQIEVGA